MSSHDKYFEFFKFGDPSVSYLGFETIPVTPDVDLVYMYRNNSLYLSRKIQLNGLLLIVCLNDSGKKWISSGSSFHFTIVDYKDGFYYITSNDSMPEGLTFAEKNGIITNFYSDRKSLYKVRFNQNLKLDFNEVSGDFLKCFQSPIDLDFDISKLRVTDV